MMYTWHCPHCDYSVSKPGKPALGMARENHLRKHRVPVHYVEYIPRDYGQYPEEICEETDGDCKNCPLPENMRGQCIDAQHCNDGKGHDTGKRP